MSDPKTIPAVLDALLRPRRMRRIHGTIARTRADGAWFDAVLWSVFAVVSVGALLVLLQLTDLATLQRHGIDETWVVAGAVLLGIFVAAGLWWRWFKWHVNAEMLAEREGFEPSSRENP
jgi:uncharacterized membrane protein